MLPYILIALSPLIISKFVNPNSENENRKKRFYIILGIILIVFIGFRSRYLGSTDTRNYYNMLWRATWNTSWDSFYVEGLVETGFQRALWIISRYFKWPQIIIILTAILYVSAILYFISRNSCDPVMSSILYITFGLMTFEMQGMRQSIAMSICIFGYELAKNRKLGKFLIIILLASIFHITALIFIPVYFIFNLRYNKNTLLIVSFLSIVLIYFTSNIIGFANNIFDMNYVTPVTGGGYVSALANFLIVIAAIIYNRRMRNDNNESGLFYLSLLCAVIYVMRYVGTQAAERISFYFGFAQTALLPNSIAQMKSRNRLIMYYFILLLVILLFIYHLNGSNFVPYKFFFSDGDAYW